MSGEKNNFCLPAEHACGANHDHVQPLQASDTFQFDCHPGVECFTACCRELELALTPYDTLRLKNSLAIHSKTFLDTYAVVEWPDEAPYPQVYLGMVDDGHASCPFVTEHGCKVYADRPGACRTYPVGRGSFLKDNQIQQVHVLLKEPHCHGFSESKEQTIVSWQQDQEIELYNTFNDLMLPVLNHRIFNSKKRLSLQQADVFLMALFDIDTFRQRIKGLDPEVQANPNILPAEDIDVLQFYINRLGKYLKRSV